MKPACYSGPLLSTCPALFSAVFAGMARVYLPTRQYYGGFKLYVSNAVVNPKSVPFRKTFSSIFLVASRFHFLI
jgi:hypothetical protein